jgi:hypothetical protein
LSYDLKDIAKKVYYPFVVFKLELNSHHHGKTSFGFDLTRVLGNTNCNPSVRNHIGVNRAASCKHSGHTPIILHRAASKIWYQDLLEPFLQIQQQALNIGLNSKLDINQHIETALKQLIFPFYSNTCANRFAILWRRCIIEHELRGRS